MVLAAFHAVPERRVRRVLEDKVGVETAVSSSWAAVGTQAVVSDRGTSVPNGKRCYGASRSRTRARFLPNRG